MAEQSDTIVDVAGASATDETLLGNVDGRANKLGNLKGYIAGEKLDSGAVAPAFSPSSAYGLNTYVTYGGNLYVCKASVSAPTALR